MIKTLVETFGKVMSETLIFHLKKPNNLFRFLIHSYFSQTFVKATLLESQFYDKSDKIIDLFPNTIQNAHYVALVSSLQRYVAEYSRNIN